MGDCRENCPVAEKVNRLEEQLDEYQAQNGDSHREIYGRLNALESTSAVQGTRFDFIIEKLDNLTKSVEEINQKPAKRWEAVIAAVISALVSGVVVWLLAGGRIG